MDTRAIRFHPPQGQLPAEIAWVLARAFAPAESPSQRPPDARIALNLATRLGLAPRIAARQPADLLERELGGEIAREMREACWLTAGRTMRMLEVARRVALVAHEISLPLVFLKSMALHVLGLVAVGSRPAADVDVLVPAAGAARLARELAAHGFTSEDLRPGELHLPPLLHRAGVALEIHTLIRGLSLPSVRAWVTADDLLRGGLCEPAPDFPTGVVVPRRDVLIAHALVHGFVEHGGNLDKYPLARMLGDLVDLGFSQKEIAAFLDGPFAWMEAALRRSEVTATAELCDALVLGGAATLLSSGRDGAALVLRHALLGSLDREYATSLWAPSVLAPLSFRSRPFAIADRACKTLLLTRAQIDIIYGRQESWRGYLKWRLLRPFGLAWRLASSTWSRLRMRANSRS